MKLHEIVMTNQTVRKTDKDIGRLQTKFRTNKKVTKKGHGNHAVVGQHKSRPHDVLKIAEPESRRIEKDGYFQYIKALADQGLMGSNPYFPRVYNLDALKDKGGIRADVFTARIEPLEPLQKLDPKELYAMVEKIMQAPPETLPRLKDDPYHSDTLISCMVQFATGNEFHLAKDEKFREAAEFVFNQLDQGVGEFDITRKNLMARRTSHGMELVFADPLY